LALGLWAAGLFLLTVKYYEFLRATAQALLGAVGLSSALPLVDVVTPVGVSFFTFQAITYLVWVGQGPARARSLKDVLLFLSFWPTLFAGPILRAATFFGQIDAKRPGRPRKAMSALYLIMLGLTQKMLLSSWLAEQFVDPVFRLPEQTSGLVLTASMVAYSLQIFLDFGGYTLIVTGLGLLLGYELPVNFRQPYLARNLQDFWARWHVSLSSFIRDYIYIPLGGNRLGWYRTQLNVMAGMFISGMWHGANWTFIVWGLLHGVGVVALHVMRRLDWPQWPLPFARLATFAFVTLAWVFFRADSIDQAWSVLLGVFNSPTAWWHWQGKPVGYLALLLAVFWVLSLNARRCQAGTVRAMRRLGWIATCLGMGAVLHLVVALGPEGVPGFIYYRF
jgi:alginate O-acetyltransferase complex protein AlgI